MNLLEKIKMNYKKAIICLPEEHIVLRDVSVKSTEIEGLIMITGQRKIVAEERLASKFQIKVEVQRSKWSISRLFGFQTYFKYEINLPSDWNAKYSCYVDDYICIRYEYITKSYIVSIYSTQIFFEEVV